MHDLFINIGDLEEVDRLVEERSGRFFVGGIESAWHCSAFFCRIVGELEAPESFEVGFFEREVWCFDGIPGFKFVGLSLWVEKGVLDGEAHIWPAELGEHAGIFELDHAVDDALRVNYDFDLADRGAKEPMSFDDFETFIH